MLVNKKDKLSDQSYRMRGLNDHPVHAEHRRTHNKLKEEIRRAKQDHWTAYLEGLNQNDVYLANKYITTPYGDGGRTSIPTLKIQTPNGNLSEAVMNEEKSHALACSFFPPPPTASTVPQGFNYPDTVESFTPFNEREVARIISNTVPLKAPGPDGICNIVFKKCKEQLVPYLTHLFNTTLELGTYYDP